MVATIIGAILAALGIFGAGWFKAISKVKEQQVEALEKHNQKVVQLQYKEQKEIQQHQKQATEALTNPDEAKAAELLKGAGVVIKITGDKQ